MVLSICVVTMNRANQLKEALESCLKCSLPEETEFVIVDNASTDETEKIVEDIFALNEYKHIYIKNKENVGAGKGRNMYYQAASGKYIYGMDDDAVIAYNENPDFFVRAVRCFEENPDIVSLATQIYDKAWQKNRQVIDGKIISDGVYKCKMFCGGSHFLRRSFYKTPPYLSNIYGYEELPPSLMAWDAGKINAFCPDLKAIHQPLVDRWNRNNNANDGIVINECATQYAVKKSTYPLIFVPILYMAYKARCKMYLKGITDGEKRANLLVKETCLLNKNQKKIRIKTVIKMFKDFGISIF